MRVRCIKFGYPNFFDHQPSTVDPLVVGKIYHSTTTSRLTAGPSFYKINNCWYPSELFEVFPEIPNDFVMLSKDTINEFLELNSSDSTMMAVAVNLLNHCGVNVKVEQKTTYKVE
jgi:hypothetical protein